MKEGKAEREEAHDINHFFSQIKEIKQKTELSKTIIREIILDIKQLNCSKEFTTSITA